MSEIEALKMAVETFIELKGWTPTRFGSEAANDPRLVFQLRAGREPRTATRMRVLEFIRNNSTRNNAA